ncbi:hypothetical protein COO91_11059 (plasmid) [Nostoc flagelliforme CCNUN1]|uniref:Uncharacterized protein n=1 Tax=Nostoc flagelliforme CCNUN1 TaxID=2038116 RepID=A0A2K8TAW8_9NOSO|nr:hypothetical protein [Nostoc flagelliforme]AUB44812.1 hypothetical protein COO91_11059 [Nostoc flagelliforme CCNUN1]
MPPIAAVWLRSRIRHESVAIAYPHFPVVIALLSADAVISV